MNPRRGKTLIAITALFCAVFAHSAVADSQARIVRLSDVQGSVEMDRSTGQGYEKAFLNTPITQGANLRAGADGRAEVEFEDGSTIRLTPNTALRFTDLSLRDSGGKVTTVDVQKGEAYFEFLGRKDDEFTVTFGHEKATVTRPTHFRIDLDETSAELSVFKGDVQVVGPSGGVQVASKHTATFDLLDDDHFELAKNIPQDAYDAWDKQQNDYQRYGGANSFNSPYDYGMRDLTYYGSFMNLAGGSCWQPYFTGFGWDPFMDGAWMYYPGYGYTWVSAYPWGWLPYHSGSWMYANSGWCWRPSPTWVVWNTVPVVINPPAHFRPPHPPIIPPSRGIVVVGRGPTASTLLTGTRQVVITGFNAGIGIPRGRLNLGHLDQEVTTKGQATFKVPFTATMPIVSSMPEIGRTSGGTSAGHTSGPAHATVASHASGGIFGGGHVSSSHASTPSHSSSGSHR